MNGLDALAALFAPATQTVTTTKLPKVRKSCCEKCPFGTRLTDREREKADFLKGGLEARLAGGDIVAWGCHETASGKSPVICPGFLEWKRGLGEAAR